MVNGQMYQDFIAAIILGRDGFFVDIGAGWGGGNKPPVRYLSNTFMLEQEGGWNGIAIDYDEEYCAKASEARSCNLLCVDLMKENINDLLDNAGCPKVIDYLSLDCDDAQDKVFNEFDWDNRKCKFMTIEHNLYYEVGPKRSPFEKSRKEAIKFHRESRERFKSAGYKMLSSNVSIETFGPVEDWYVHPDFLEEDKYSWLDNTEDLYLTELRVLAMKQRDVLAMQIRERMEKKQGAK